MSEVMLLLDGIEKTYNAGTPGEVQVLRGATLSVAAGEVVALVAPSGAGKSTLLHIAGLLDTPDAGHVRLAGRAMEGLSDRARTAARRGDVGFIYQFHHLLPEFSALENIVLPQLANGVARAAAEARAIDLLSRVGMNSAEELGASFGLDVTDQAFWASSLAVLDDRIAHYQALAAQAAT